MNDDTVTMTDTLAVDQLAALLGANDDWPGADTLTLVADIIGRVRPHPGNIFADAYPTVFREMTGRDLPATTEL